MRRSWPGPAWEGLAGWSVLEGTTRAPVPRWTLTRSASLFLCTSALAAPTVDDASQPLCPEKTGRHASAMPGLPLGSAQATQTHPLLVCFFQGWVSSRGSSSSGESPGTAPPTPLPPSTGLAWLGIPQHLLPSPPPARASVLPEALREWTPAPEETQSRSGEGRGQEWGRGRKEAKPGVTGSRWGASGKADPRATHLGGQGRGPARAGQCCSPRQQGVGRTSQ